VTAAPAISDIYELSPMQRAMLFHALHTPGTSTSFNQFNCRITGDLEPHLFREAWQRLVDRHAVLRTSFHWEELDKPVQIVHPDALLPWTWNDWRDVPSGIQRARWREYLERDLAAGFALDRAPLMRCCLTRIAENEYLFNWSHHHLLTDGWCLSLVMEEIFQVYGHLARGLPLDLPAARPYRDYIEWLQRQDEAASKQYWTRYLEGFRSPTPMPAPRVSDGGAATEQLRSELPEGLSARLRAFAAQHRMTLSTVVQGAWAILLARYAAETDVVFGTTVSGRPAYLPGIETMLGLFINTIPVRMRVDPRQPLVPWLKMIQARQAARSQFEHAPLPEIQRWSEIPPATPLFESNVIFMNYPLDESLTHGAHGLAIDEIELYDRADVPLELQVTARGRWEIDLAFDPLRFDPAAMRRMLGHFGALLENFVAEPAKPVGRFSILTEPERHELLADFNDTEIPFDADDNVVRRLERAAALHPAQPAVECEGTVVSFHELNSRANRLARRLLGAAPLRPDDLVAIVAPRSERMIEAILAIWKCGAAYVPIDPEYPADRIRTILEDSQARIVLTLPGLLDPEVGAMAPVVFLNDSGVADDSNLEIAISPDSLAYVIYTSGSTGKPKGAMVEHAGMLNHLLAKVDELSIATGTVIAQNASHCFDISVWQFFAAPLAGGKTVIAGNDLVRDPARFLEYIEATGIDILELVPSHLAVLLERAEAQPYLLRHLKCLLVTGETVRPSLLEAWFAAFPQVPVINAYGPTEASDDITHHRMTQAPATASVPVGKPIRNLHIHIVDEQMNLCPIGVSGELCVSGVGVGRGYLNDEIRTKAAFLEDPFHAQRGVRMYRTGDIGCFLPDGSIILAGRKDHQIKIRGHRIEPGEVENALTRIPQIREAAVAAHRDPAGHASLCAWVAFRPGVSLTVSEISAALSVNMPEHMIPGIYVTMESLPLTRNGKVDRRALPAPDHSRRSSERTHTPPRTAVETLLCGIWGEALGIETTGIHDNLFTLGGDSILSMRIVSLAARAGLKITTRQIFQNPTVAELATVATAAQPKAREYASSSGRLPLTPIQRRFFSQNKANRDQYNQAVLLKVPASLDVSMLREALRHAARTHDALRLRFRQDGAGWIQEVVPDADVPVGVHDIQADGLATGVAQAHAALSLSDGPVFRADLFRFDGNARLLFVAHHLCIDGVSWGALLETIYSRYMGLPTTEPGATWTEWARASAELTRASNLSHLPAAAIPLDYRPPAGLNVTGSAEEIVLEMSEAATAALLTSAPLAYRARINDLLLAALALAVGEWSGNSTVLLDLETHGREEVIPDIDISRTVGWFTAMSPVVLRIGPEQSDPGSAIKSIKEQLRAVPNGARSESIPQPQLLFNYLGQTDRVFSSAAEWKLAPESSGSGRSPGQLREHVLALNCYVSGNRLRIAWEFSRHLHRRETIHGLARNYLARLESLIAHCSEGTAHGFTPSDFPAARLSQASLDTLAAAIPDEIADVYALTPTQQGMLFHSLRAPASDAYHNSLSCLIEGDLDIDRFRDAWRATIERHPILRTSFHWEGIEAPVQVVHREVDLAWFNDLAWFAGEVRHGFDFTEAPLMRIGLFKVGPKAWRFTWSHHHILLDGWSSGLVMREAIAAYGGLPPDLLASPRPAPPPFREHVLWLQRQDQAAAERFWRDRLQGFDTATPLPLGRPEMEGIAGTGKYVEEELLLSARDTRSLLAFAHANRITLNTLAQGAWALLLGRYSGEADVVFGTIVSGRPASLPDSDRMVGLFINALPVRALIDESALAPWLQRLQADLARQDEYAWYPLAEIQKITDLQPGTPLFESLLIFQNFPVYKATEKALDGLRIGELQVFDPNNYPLTLMVTPGEQLSVRALYDDARFDRETIARILRHFETLVNSFAAAAGDSIVTLPILTAGEQRQMEAWNDTAALVPSEKTLLDLIEAAAREHPERVAVRCDGIARTYRDLSRRSDRIARHLLSLAPIQPDDRIALLMPRSHAMLETILAIWKCGAAYVPIDPAYPQQRIEAILAGARPVLVVTSAHDPDLSPEEDPDSIFEPRCQPGHLAYVIFTSGSTGKPKGAMLEHRGMLNHVLAMARELGLGSRSVIAQTASHCSDISVWQFFAALVAGGETVIYRDSTVLEPAQLIDRIDIDGVTAMQFVPTYLSAFLAELEKRHEAGEWQGFRRLEFLVTIGETLQPAAVRDWFRLNPGVRLMNAYGPTEASDSIAHYTMERAPELPSIPLGRPVQNLRLYIVDRYMNLCPAGVKGEICVSGVGVGRGYLFDEERTRAVFQEDPFCAERGVRFYRTGDIGCFAPDGNILFFGRRDFQIKIRGYRIELGEIESALTSLEGIGSAVVVAREESGGGKYLCGYATGTGWTPAALRSALREKLPSHMVPDVMLLLPELPVTPNGKINRAALPVPHAEAVAAALPASPRTPVEAALVQIFSEVLGRDSISIDDNFFELGGHSLKAIVTLSRIRRELNLAASIGDIFGAPTPRALAEKLEQATPVAEAAIPALPDRPWYAASHAQKLIWLAGRNADSSAWNMAGALQVDGPIDADKLVRALELLADRHESLRTVFAMVEGELKQKVLTRELSGFRVERMSVEDGLDGMIRDEAQQPFDLARGPLFRARLIRQTPVRHVLLLTLHHAIADAWSIHVLTRDLLALYEGRDLPPLSIQYRDYAAWQNALLESPEMQALRDYWLATLSAPLPRLEIPLDYPRPARLSHAGRSLELDLGETEIARLTALALRCNASLYAVIMSSICILLHRYTGAEDLVIGTVSAGRDREQLEPQIGAFLNPVALRIRIQKSNTVEEVIGIVSRASSEALAHASYPFDRLLEELKVRTPANHSPLFDVQVDYIPALETDHDLPVTVLARPETASKFDLSFHIVEESGKLRISFIYNTGLFRPETIATMRDRLMEIQQACVRDPRMPIGTNPRVRAGLHLKTAVAAALSGTEQ